MRQLVVLPLWQWLGMIAALLLVVTPSVGIPSAIIGFKMGVKKAIKICSAHWACPMNQEKQQEATTQDLSAQLKAMHEQDPDLFARLERARKRALADTDPNLPAVPEEKPR